MPFCWHSLCSNMINKLGRNIKLKGKQFVKDRGMDSIKRILIVASEAMITDMLQRHLKRRGLYLEKAASDDEAKSVFKGTETKYDLVIADLFGTRVNGLKFFNWFKKKYPDTPMLVLSGYGSLDMTMQILRPELDGYCRKPFTPQEMLASLEEINEKMKTHNRQMATNNG